MNFCEISTMAISFIFAVKKLYNCTQFSSLYSPGTPLAQYSPISVLTPTFESEIRVKKVALGLLVLFSIVFSLPASAYSLTGTYTAKITGPFVNPYYGPAHPAFYLTSGDILVPTSFSGQAAQIVNGGLADLKVGVEVTVTYDFRFVTMTWGNKIVIKNAVKPVPATPPANLAITPSSMDELTVSFDSVGQSNAGFAMAYSTGKLAPVCDSSAIKISNVSTPNLKQIAPGITYKIIGSKVSVYRQDLYADTLYTISVCSYNSEGEISDQVSATQKTLFDPTVPPKPVLFGGTSRKPGEMELVWRGGVPGDYGYVLAFLPGQNATPDCKNGGKVGGRTNYVRPNMDRGKWFSVSVCAISSSNILSESRTVHVKIR